MHSPLSKMPCDVDDIEKRPFVSDTGAKLATNGFIRASRHCQEINNEYYLGKSL